MFRRGREHQEPSNGREKSKEKGLWNRNDRGVYRNSNRNEGGCMSLFSVSKNENLKGLGRKRNRIGRKTHG